MAEVTSPDAPPRSLAWVAAAWGLALPALAGKHIILFRDGDLPVHLRYGLEIISSRGLPAVDPVLAPATLFVDHEWLSDVLLASLWSVGGLSAIAIFTQGLLAFCLAGSVAVMARAGAGALVQALTMLVLTLTAWSHLATRPHVLSWALLVGVLWAKPWWSEPRRRSHPGMVAAWFGLSAMWVNLHGGVLILPVLLGVYAVLELAVSWRTRTWRARLVPFTPSIVVALGLLVNPWGPALLSHILDFLRSDIIAVTDDFQPPRPFATMSGLAMVYLCGWALILVWWGRRAWRDVVWVVLWLVWGWTASRNVAFAAWIVAPSLGALAENGAREARGEWREILRRLDHRLAPLARRGVGWLVVGAVAGFGPHLFAPVKPSAPQVPVETISALPAGPVLVAANTKDAGWIALLRPDVQLHFHSLTANFADADRRLPAYLAIWSDVGSAGEALALSGVQVVVVSPEHALSSVLRTEGWRLDDRGSEREIWLSPERSRVPVR